MEKIQSNLFSVESCRAERGCPRALINPTELKKRLENIFQEINFAELRIKLLGEKILHHHLFKVALAGCPNCCSQPQIKDFGASFKVEPAVNNDLCSGCGLCIRSCKERGLYMSEKGIVFDETLCVGCGDCQRVCPTKAINVRESSWNVMAGGKLGRHPQLALTLALKENEDQVGALLKECLKLYLENKNPHLRFGDVLNAYKNTIIR